MSKNTPAFFLLGSCVFPHLAALDASAVVAIGGAVATVIAAVSAALLSWKAASKAESVAAKTEAVATKTDSLLAETAKIHTLANDNFSRSQASLAVANEKILGLEKLMTTLATDKQNAQELAMKKADVPPPPLAAPTQSPLST